MGDMADFTLESIEWSIYNGYEDDDGYEQPINTKTCKCCGRSGLHWALRKDKWRLHDDRGLHMCSVNPLKE